MIKKTLIVWLLGIFGFALPVFGATLEDYELSVGSGTVTFVSPITADNIAVLACVWMNDPTDTLTAEVVVDSVPYPLTELYHSISDPIAVYGYLGAVAGESADFTFTGGSGINKAIISRWGGVAEFGGVEYHSVGSNTTYDQVMNTTLGVGTVVDCVHKLATNEQSITGAYTEITKTNLFAGDTIGSQYTAVEGDPTALSWTTSANSDWDGIIAYLVDGEQPTTPTSTPSEGEAMVNTMVSSTWSLIARSFPLVQWFLGFFAGLFIFGIVIRYTVGKKAIPKLFK